MDKPEEERQKKHHSGKKKQKKATAATLEAVSDTEQTQGQEPKARPTPEFNVVEPSLFWRPSDRQPESAPMPGREKQKHQRRSWWQKRFGRGNK